MTTPVHCDACGSALLDDAAFCHGCGAPAPGALPLAEHGSTGITVLSIDAFGSIAFDERLDATQWHEVVERFFAVVSSTVQRHGGSVGRLTGNGIEVVFRASAASERHAMQACRAALCLRDRLRDLAATACASPGILLSARIGLASGEVPRPGCPAGGLARSAQDARDALPAAAGGPAPWAALAAVATRVRELARPGDICLCEDTAQLLDDAFSLRAVGSIARRDGSRRRHAFALVDARDEQPAPAVVPATTGRPLVGREHELTELEHALRDTRRGGLTIVGLVGDPGVGKTRLAEHFAARQRERGVPVHVTRCAAHSRWTPFHTTVPFLRGAFGLGREDDPATIRGRILEVLHDVDPALLDTVPLLATAFGIADPGEASQATAGRAPARDIARILRAMLERYRPTEPSLFVVDDHHWMDPGADSVFAELVREQLNVPLLLLVTYRPGHHRPWMRATHFHELSLAPLDAGHTLDLARTMMGGDRSLHRLQERLVERAAGNPLFVEETVLALAASGTLEGSPQRYRLRDSTPPALPDSIDDVLASRIAGLALPDKAVLQAAAVIGRSFPLALLARVTQLDPAQLGASVRALEHRALLSADPANDGGEPSVHQFRHPLQQRVAYDSLPPQERAELHRRVAAELIQPHGTRGNPDAGRIAVHCEAAGDLVSAARWHRRAAVQLIGWNPAQSYVHWRCVLSCSAREDGAEAARLRLSACEAVVRLGIHHGLAPDEAEALAGEGQEIARRLGDVRMQALLSTAIGSLRGSTGDLVAGLAHQRTAFHHAERTGAAGLALMTGAQLLFSHRVAGHTVEGLQLADALIERYGPDGARALGAEVVWLRQVELGRAMLLIDRGRLDDGGAALTRVLAVLRDEGAPVAYAWALSLTAAVVRFAGDPAPVLAARIEEAYERARRCGVPSLVGRALCSLATLRLCQNRWSEARRYAEQADATMRELGHTFYVDFDPRLMLSYARFGLGDIAGAQAAAGEAMRHAFRSGARLGQIDTMATLGRLLVRYGTLERIVEGRSMLRHGLALTRRCGARSREPFFWLEIAGLERRAGNERHALACERRGVRQLLAMNAHGHLPRAAVPPATRPALADVHDRPSR